MKSVANTFNYSTCLTVLLLCGTAINTAWSWILPTCTTTHVSPVISPMLSRISATTATATATATAARRNTRLLFAKVRTNLKDAIEPDSVLAVPSKAKLKSKSNSPAAQTQPATVVLPHTMSSQVEALLSSGLDYNELSLIMTIISHECQQLGISYSTSSTMISRMTSPLPVFSNTLHSACSVVGALGRVLVCRVASGLSPELVETLEEGVCEQLDVMMAGGDHDDDNDNDNTDNDHNNDREDGFLQEAVLISFQQMNDDIPAQLSPDNDIDGELGRQYLAAIVEEQVREYDMMIPLRIRSGQDDDYNKNNDNNINNNSNNNQPSTLTSSHYLLPSIHVEMDGGYVTDYSTNTASEDDELSVSSEKQEQEKEPATIWDSSSLLVFDNLVNDDLRKRLLDVVIGSDSNLHDERTGPDPSRWVRGKLLDVPNEDDNNDDTDDDNNNDSDTNIDNNNDQSIIGTGWGLSDDALEEICFQSHEAFLEMESIIATVFPNFRVSRLPEVVLGTSVTPLTANAPTTGDVFDYHIDADPWMTPSSPWTDIYGRYPNRAAGKPRFMSCLIYLNKEWDSAHWGAPTRFVDVPDVTHPEEELVTYEVPVSPGRCLIMDQDLGHTVVAPQAAAGTQRPRYSLVWKLILHPRTEGQDMKDLAAPSSTSNSDTDTGLVGKTKSVSLWPDIEYFGSAARDATID